MKKFRFFTGILLSAILACLAPDCAAAQTIVVGDHDLQPNTANQQITISVTGGTAIQGMNFNVQLGDSTDINDPYNGPVVSSADILSGTIFDGNNTGTRDGDGPNETFPNDVNTPPIL